MKLKNKKYLVFSSLGSLILITSSSALLANSLSRNNYNVVNYNKNTNFVSQEKILEAFKKAEIEEKLIEKYSKEVINLSEDKNNDNYLSNFLDTNIEIQNELSSRLVTKNYSENKVRTQIGYVKSILSQNIDAMSIVSNNLEMKTIAKLEFFKYGFEEWSNLNNVDKYKLIFNFREQLNNVLGILNKTKLTKMEIIKRKIKNNDEIIQSNENKINKLLEEMKTNDQQLNKLKLNLIDIDNIWKDFESVIASITKVFDELTLKFILAEGAGVATIAAVALSLWIPIATIPAFFANLAFQGAVSFYGISVDDFAEGSLTLVEFYEDNLSFEAIWTDILDVIALLPFDGHWLFDIFKKEWGTISNLMAVVQMYEIARTMWKIGDSYLKQKDSKNRTISDYTLVTSDETKKEREKIAKQIEIIDYNYSRLASEKNSLENSNMNLQMENTLLNSKKTEIELEFGGVKEVFSQGNLLSFSEENISERQDNFDENTDYELENSFANLRFELENEIQILNNKNKEFRSQYNYNDKNYWEVIFQDIFLSKIDSLNNLFY